MQLKTVRRRDITLLPLWHDDNNHNHIMMWDGTKTSNSTVHFYENSSTVYFYKSFYTVYLFYSLGRCLCLPDLSHRIDVEKTSEAYTFPARARHAVT
eukprot:7474364-Pyramimonas_sp.AAC.1